MITAPTPTVVSADDFQPGAAMTVATEIDRPGVGEELHCLCEASLLMIALPKLPALGDLWWPFARKARA